MIPGNYIKWEYMGCMRFRDKNILLFDRTDSKSISPSRVVIPEFEFEKKISGLENTIRNLKKNRCNIPVEKYYEALNFFQEQYANMQDIRQTFSSYSS